MRAVEQKAAALKLPLFIPYKASLEEFATALLYVLPMHIFGYEMALQRGYDPTARRYDIVPQKVRYQGEG